MLACDLCRQYLDEIKITCATCVNTGQFISSKVEDFTDETSVKIDTFIPFICSSSFFHQDMQFD